MLELDMTTLLRHQNPTIGLQSSDDQATVHCVYLYTLIQIVNVCANVLPRLRMRPKENVKKPLSTSPLAANKYEQAAFTAEAGEDHDDLLPNPFIQSGAAGPGKEIVFLAQLDFA